MRRNGMQAEEIKVVVAGVSQSNVPDSLKTPFHWWHHHTENTNTTNQSTMAHRTTNVLQHAASTAPEEGENQMV
jgi:UDP-glucose 4-epimerase